MTTAITCLLLAYSLTAIATTDDGRIVFACNYTVSVTIDGKEFEVSHQDRVRSGSYIPLHLEDYVLALRIISAADDSAIVELVLSEESNGKKTEIYTSPPSFSAKLGMPVDFQHSDAIAQFDVSLIVSRLSE